MGEQTRGERNRNPGNINFNAEVSWQGQVGIEIPPAGADWRPRFARFSADVYGIRALAKLLANYIRLEHCANVDAIVDRWAPPGDHNDTEAYKADVCRRTGFARDQVLSADADTLGKLASAIIHHENGRCLYAPAIIARAVDMALGKA